MKRIAIASALVATCAVLTACAGTAAPAAKVKTFHVTPQGGGAVCSLRDPCGSFEAAYRVAEPGSRIVVGGGRYGPQVIPALGRRKPSIEVAAARGARVSVAGIEIRADYVVLRRIKSTSYLTVDSKVPDDPVDHVTVIDTDAHNHYLVGTRDFTWRRGRLGPSEDEKISFIAGRPTNYRATYDGVTWHDATRTTQDVHTECLMALGVQGLTIRNSRFTNCAVFDILISRLGGDPLSRDVLIENTVLEASRDVDGSGAFYSLLTGTDPIEGLTLRNNVWDLGLSFQGPIVRGRFEGNIAKFASCVEGVTYSHNIFGDRKCGKTDRIVARPFRQFVDAANGDWHLKRGAAAIGAADPRSHPARDASGAKRVGRADAGPFEYRPKG